MQRGNWFRPARQVAAVLAGLVALTAAIAWHDTMRDPEVLTAQLEIPALPPQQLPLRHDHWRNASTARAELKRAGMTVLANSAVRRGPLAIGGLDDDFTGHANVPQVLAAIRLLGGVPVMLSHSPDVFPQVPEDVPLTLAGHTHCGQVRFPWGGTPATMSRYGDRYACGLVHESGHTLIVSAGLGVSVLPFRFGTHPDMWVITLGPAKPRQARNSTLKGRHLSAPPLQSPPSRGN